MILSPFSGSVILADFGGIGILVLLALLAVVAGCVLLSVIVAVFDRRRVQFVLAVISCALFSLLCFGFFLGVLDLLGLAQAAHYPPFGLMIPPITAIQFILYALKVRRRAQR
jgi:hypothetical protein